MYEDLGGPPLTGGVTQTTLFDFGASALLRWLVGQTDADVPEDEDPWAYEADFMESLLENWDPEADVEPDEEERLR